jgi:hypothetical protein
MELDDAHGALGGDEVGQGSREVGLAGTGRAEEDQLPAFLEEVDDIVEPGAVVMEAGS